MRPPPGSSVRVMETKQHLDPGTRRRSSPCSQTSSPRPRPPSHRPPPRPRPPRSCRCECPRAASTWPGPSRTQRRWAPATVCEVVTYIWNFVFQNQDRSKKPLGMKLKTSYSKFLLYKLKFCKIRRP